MSLREKVLQLRQRLEQYQSTLAATSSKLSVRARLQLLCDAEPAFLELSAFAAWEVYPEVLPRAGVLTGIGYVAGQACMVIANDPAVKAGTYYPLTVKKHLRALEIALAQRLPCIYLVDSGGANLLYQDQVFPDKEHFGRIFYYQAQLSAAGVPQLAVVLGSCTAGGAYIPAMADECIMVQQQATVYLAGPPLVKAATGEQVTEQELGGADLHCRISGVADYYAHDEAEAMGMARNILQYLPQKPQRLVRQQAPQAPLYPAEELYDLIPTEARQHYDVRALLARIVDASVWQEFKALYGKTVICCFAAIDGYQVGILVNNGIIFSEAALKATHFIQLCCKRGLPLIFLQNVTGFMVGKHYEAQGITKHGAKLVMAVANATVPKFTVIIGNSFGAGNYGMCGRAYQPDFLWSWPNAKLGVMGGEQAQQVLLQLQRKKNLSEQQQAQLRQQVEQQFQQQLDPYYASARIWDDGIIDPAETRLVLARALSLVLTSRVTTAASEASGIYRM
jgi:3-methylcrotonyl-CoA carboxylase beta subunit